ncbi:CPBP family intramembrane glutamic endopeptidase [Lederbergia citrea]|uniref:CPBP family intramembrane glutamic endopeptidase n=1 Tax=Lederbergia citrea TaxID=2833581 RepID=UPI001BCA18B1|nr:CPBP family intramembrane metalloprotease [Lederbergia citrea]
MIDLKQRKYYFFFTILGFILLDIYLNVFIAKTNNIVTQLLLVILFFPLLKIILKATKLNSFKSIGIAFHPKWKRNLIIGFSIGFTFWLIKYALVYILNGFEIVGVKSLSESLITFFFVFFAFFIGSFLNDIIIRGYIFGHLKDKINGKWIFIISILIYALDDSWNEGFSLSNTLFSIALGLSLTYSFYRTSSIWADTGIHWGLNVCYGIFNGMLGSSNGGIFIITDNANPSIIIDSISYIIPLLMFLFLYLLRGKLIINKDDYPKKR